MGMTTQDNSFKKPEYLYDLKAETFRKNMFAVAGTNAAGWSYEKEVRIILATTAIRQERFLPLTPESIAAVYYGCRMSQSDKDAVEAILGQPHFQHVEQRLGVLTDYEYRLRFDKA